MNLTAQQLAELAVITAAVCIPTPDITFIYCCPRWPGIHECPASLDVPAAERMAAYLSETTGTEAYVLVYGIPWTT